MPEKRHDTHKMSQAEIDEAIASMPDGSVAPPPLVQEAILDAQLPAAVSCPQCGAIFVPGESSADGGTTLDDREEAPTRPT